MNFRECEFCPYFNQHRLSNCSHCASVSYEFYCSLRLKRCSLVASCDVWVKYCRLYAKNLSINQMVTFREKFYKRLWLPDDCGRDDRLEHPELSFCSPMRF